VSVVRAWRVPPLVELIVHVFDRSRVLLRGHVVEVLGGNVPVEESVPAPPKPPKRRRKDADSAAAAGKHGPGKEPEDGMASPLYKLRTRRVRKTTKPTRLSSAFGDGPRGGDGVPPVPTASGHGGFSVPSFRIVASLAEGSPSLELPISTLTALSRAKRLPTQATFTDAIQLSKQLSHLLPSEFNGTTLTEWKAFCAATPLTFALTLYRTSGTEVEVSIESVYV
jgi:hypothetical protein